MIIILLVESFSTQALAGGFQFGMKDCKSPQESRTHLSILADPKDAVVWMAQLIL